MHIFYYPDDCVVVGGEISIILKISILDIKQKVWLKLTGILKEIGSVLFWFVSYQIEMV